MVRCSSCCERIAKMKDKCIIGEEVISIENGVKLTKVLLSDEAQRGLSTNGVEIPPLTAKAKAPELIFSVLVSIFSLTFFMFFGLDGIFHKHYAVGIAVIILGIVMNIPAICYHYYKYKSGC